MWIALALLGGIAAGVLASRVWRFIPRSEAGDPASSIPGPSRSGSKIELQVARRGNDLELTWTRNPALYGSGSHGILRINDNGVRNEILLDAGQLAGGRILYVPRSGDVEVTLAVQTGKGATLTDTLRVLQPGFASQTGAPAANQRPQPAASNPAPVGTAQRTVPASVKAPPREFVLPPSVGAKSTVGQPGTIRVEPLAVGATVDGLQTPLTPAPTPVPGPPASAPLSAPVSPPVARTSPPQPAPERTASVPAVPLRQARLSIPRELRQRLSEELAIKVEVSLDPQGRVTDVTAERQPSVAATELAALAVANVRLWQFVPANVGGKPVASKYVVTFHIKP